MTEQAIFLLREQQSKVKERSGPWMVAEQLMDLCRREPKSAELIAQAEQQIKAFADQHKTGNFAGVTGMEAEEILRKFYGLPDPQTDKPSGSGAVSVDLADFL